MGDKSTSMWVVTWNVHRRDVEVLDALEKASRRLGQLDLITLQEVRVEVADTFRDRLLRMGLKHVHYIRRLEVPCQCDINLIASRWPLEPVRLRYSRKQLPWPQALTEVSVSVGSRAVVVITAHIPNGSKYGWQKIDTFTVLNDVVGKAADAPCIVTGDFNEPQYAIQDGRVVTWGQWREAPHGRFVCGGTWKDPHGKVRPQ